MSLEGGDLLGVQIDPLQFVLAVEAHQGMCKPALEVLLSGLLDVVARVPQEPVAQEQALGVPYSAPRRATRRERWRRRSRIGRVSLG
jgi:hypothetical protein